MKNIIIAVVLAVAMAAGVYYMRSGSHHGEGETHSHDGGDAHSH